MITYARLFQTSWFIRFAAVFFIAAVLAVLVPAVGRAAGGAVLLSPTNRWVAPAETFTVDVFVESTTRVNAVEGTITYPKTTLQATTISTDGSIITLWAEQPAINADQGTVRFAGGITGGFSGKGKIMSVQFRALQAGRARVTIEDSSVLAHDGLGTSVGGTAAAGRYTVQASRPNQVFLEPGDLIKLPDDSNPATTVDTAVYYYGVDGLRYVFPNDKTYFTWYADFRNVKVVSAAQLGTIGIGGNVTYRPGTKMVKINSDPKVYAVSRGGILRHMASEALATALYGATWNREIHDVPDSFFTNYTMGVAIAGTTGFIPVEATAGTASISVDKSLEYPIEVFMGADGSFTPAVFTVTAGHTARFTNNGSSTQRVKAAAEAGLPGLDSANIPPGLDYVFRFPRVGSFGLYNAGDTGKTATAVIR